MVRLGPGYAGRMGRRKRTIAAAVLVLALGAAPASADPPRDFAGGSAKNVQFGVDGHVSFAAFSHALGTDPGGFFRARGTFLGQPFAQQGEVTCLNVKGSRASVKYRFRQAQGFTEQFEGGGIQFFVEDNGEPRGGEPVDAATFDPPQPAAVFDATAGVCDDPNTRVTYDTVDSGDLSVRDAP